MFREFLEESWSSDDAEELFEGEVYNGGSQMLTWITAYASVWVPVYGCQRIDASV